MISHMFELKRPDPSHPDYQATLPKGDNAECAEFEVRPVLQCLFTRSMNSALTD